MKIFIIIFITILILFVCFILKKLVYKFKEEDHREEEIKCPRCNKTMRLVSQVVCRGGSIKTTYKCSSCSKLVKTVEERRP